MRCSVCLNSLIRTFKIVYNSKVFCSEKCVESLKEPHFSVKKCCACKNGINQDQSVYMFDNKEYCSQKCRALL